MTNRLKDAEFEFEGRTLRIIGRCQREWERGYTEPSLEHYNVLEVRRTNWFAILWHWSAWQELEREHVPGHVWITLATLGDTGGWRSALHERFRQARRTAGASTSP